MDFAPFKLEFLAPCEHREFITEAKDYRCNLLSEAIGHGVGINAKMCAECMLKGTPDQAYLNNVIIKSRFTQLGLARLGFYKNEDDIVTILQRLWPMIKDKPHERGAFGTMITHLVEHKRVSLERAEKLVQEEMKELLNDGDPGSAQRGGGQAAPSAPKAGIGTDPDRPSAACSKG